MISKKMNEVLNGQVNAELYSSYLYLAMSSWFSEKSLSGFATWMRAQAQEELFHSIKILDYILERGGNVQLDTIVQKMMGTVTVLDAVKLCQRYVL